jgi:asparagine synthase (glutamine-hydrolysing)
LGAFLSGGVDSSLVVSIMQGLSERPINTFTIGFDDEAFNEAKYAKEISKHLGTNHTEMYITPAHMLNVINDIPKYFSEPLGDSSLIPTLFVSELARGSVTVSLSGDGADELFGGYKTYSSIPKLWDYIRPLPPSARKAICHAVNMPFLPGNLGKLSRVLTADNRSIFFDNYMSTVLNINDIVIGANKNTYLSDNCKEFEYLESFQELMMATDLKLYLIDDIMVKVDRSSMAHSLESRTPFLDPSIVQFAWSLPQNMKFRGNKGKIIMRELLRKYIPESQMDRPKKGFSVPLCAWLRGPLRSWADALLNKNRLANSGYFNPSKVRQIWDEHVNGHQDSSRILWNILMFQLWLDAK